MHAAAADGAQGPQGCAKYSSGTGLCRERDMTWIGVLFTPTNRKMQPPFGSIRKKMPHPVNDKI